MHFPTLSPKNLLIVALALAEYSYYSTTKISTKETTDENKVTSKRYNYDTKPRWRINNQLTITGSTDVSGTLNVTGDTSIESDLFVTGTSVHLGRLSGSLTQLTDGTSYLIEGPGITISSSSNGPITISTAAASVATYWDSTTNGSIFTTGSVAIPGAEAGTIDAPSDKGTDVFFF